MSQDHDQPAPSRGPADGFDGLMAEVLAGSGGRFGHRQHVQLTWLAVRRHGMPAAIGLVSDGIRRTARYAGAPQKYHETISRAWVELVAHHAIGHPGRPADDPAGGAAGFAAAGCAAAGCAAAGCAAAGFAAFADRNPLLLDKRLLVRFYRPATLASTAARTGWVEPDRAPFPWAGVAGSCAADVC